MVAALEPYFRMDEVVLWIFMFQEVTVNESPSAVIRSSG